MMAFYGRNDPDKSKNKKKDEEAAEQRRREWQEWLKKNAELIKKTGLPPYFFEGENWGEFNEHGLIFQTQLTVNDLTFQQRAALLRLLLTRPVFERDWRQDRHRLFEALVHLLLDDIENRWTGDD